MKYGFLCFALILIVAITYFRIIKRPGPYESWPVAYQHACVYGAYYFSYLFKANLDHSKINADCVRILKSDSLAQTKDRGVAGYFCGRGISLAYDEKIPEQKHFIRTGKVNLLSEDRAKATELVRLCLEAVRTKFEPIYKKMNAKPEELAAAVEPPPRELFRQFTNIRCEVASAPPCFD